MRFFLELALAIAFVAPATIASAPDHPRHAYETKQVPVGKNGHSSHTPRLLPKAYLLELQPKASSIGARSAESMHSQFHKRAQDSNLTYNVRQEFSDDTIFHGLSINLQSDGDAAALENLPEVKRVWPVVEIPRLEIFGQPAIPGNLTSNDVSDDFAEWLTGRVIRDENFMMDHNLKATGVDQLHSRGFKGKGIKIAVIDSGVDYFHPALGGGFGPGMKIAFGRNYVEDDQGGPNDPIATCVTGSHGTSIAGIIIGEDPKGTGFGLLGVAPEATLSMYRVSTCTSGSDSDVVLKALTDAYSDGADVVSLSIGDASGFEVFAPYDQVITNGWKRGIATIVAAGNSGKDGPITLHNAAISKDAIAVASSDSVKFPTTYKVQSSNGDEWRYSSLWPLEGEYHVYAAEDYEESIGCQLFMGFKAVQEMADRGWNLSRSIYMARRSSECAIGKITPPMTVAGVAGVIWWQDKEHPNPSDNNYPDASSMGMNHIDGPQLYKAVLNDPLGFTLNFTDRRFYPLENPSAGLTSNYSAFGNTWEYNHFKPLLSAPGHLSFSTWPLEAGGYNIVGGTSIATPFVAGCFALLKQALPNLTAKEITDLLTTTAKPSKWWGDDSIVHTVSQQGAGTVNVWGAYNSALKFEEGTLLMGQTPDPIRKSITFTNTLDKKETFKISHVPAGLMQRLPYADLDVFAYKKFGFPSKPVYAKVDFKTPTTITVEPGKSSIVELVVTPPKELDPDTIPQYSGYIRFTSTGQEAHHVAYQGMPYDLRKAPAIERDIIPGFPQLPAISKYSEEDGESHYLSGAIIPLNASEGESLTTDYFLRQPAYSYRIDVVAANTNFKPTYWGSNASQHFNTSTPELPIVDSFGGVDSLGMIDK